MNQKIYLFEEEMIIRSLPNNYLSNILCKIIQNNEAIVKGIKYPDNNFMSNSILSNKKANDKKYEQNFNKVLSTH